jgi:hypothetical protein
MAALVAAIHVFNRRKDVDPRYKSGDDEVGVRTGECHSRPEMAQAIAGEGNP